MPFVEDRLLGSHIGQLPFRIPPIAFESPRGYLCRVAHTYGYPGANWLKILLAIPEHSSVHLDNHVERTAHALRLDVKTWKAHCYLPIGSSALFEKRLFFGTELAAGFFNYQKPRVCPQCLKEQNIWMGIWDLSLVSVCSIHQCRLVDHCSSCGKHLSPYRPAVNKCRCGAELDQIAPEPADDILLALHAVIHHAAKLSSRVKLAMYQYAAFDPQLFEVPLNSLMRLILAFGSIETEQKQTEFSSSDMQEASRVAKNAADLLSDWPDKFHAALRRKLPPQTEERLPGQLRFVFGRFYDHLSALRDNSICQFVVQAFDDFIAAEWTGLLRGQHRSLPSRCLQSRPWITMQQAFDISQMAPKRVHALMKAGDIEFCIAPCGSGKRKECWISRKSLERWFTKHLVVRAEYLSCLETEDLLGFNRSTLLKIAKAGLLRIKTGPDRYLSSGTWFVRADVMTIQEAFSRHRLSTHTTRPSKGFISLAGATRLYLGRAAGLPTVIRDVMSGYLSPVQRLKDQPGIYGYVFRCEDIESYYLSKKVASPQEGFLTYEEASRQLGVTYEVMRNLATQQKFSLLEGPSKRSRFVAKEDIDRFRADHISIVSLAKRFSTRSSWVARYLKKSGINIIEISLPGKGVKLFVRRSDCASVLIPPAPRHKDTLTNKKRVDRPRLTRSGSSSSDSALA